MSLTKKQKESIVKTVTDKLTKSNVVLFTNFSNVSVERLRELRKDLKAKEASYKIVKKNLLRVALKDAKINSDEINLGNAADTIGIVFANNDQISSPKIVYSFASAKDVKIFNVLGGLFDKHPIEVSKIALLAKLSSQEELYTRLLGQLNAPLSKLVYALKAIGDQKTAS